MSGQGTKTLSPVNAKITPSELPLFGRSFFMCLTISAHGMPQIVAAACTAHHIGDGAASQSGHRPQRVKVPDFFISVGW